MQLPRLPSIADSKSQLVAVKNSNPTPKQNESKAKPSGTLVKNIKGIDALAANYFRNPFEAHSPLTAKAKAVHLEQMEMLEKLNSQSNLKDSNLLKPVSLSREYKPRNPNKNKSKPSNSSSVTRKSTSIEREKENHISMHVGSTILKPIPEQPARGKETEDSKGLIQNLQRVKKDINFAAPSFSENDSTQASGVKSKANFIQQLINKEKSSHSTLALKPSDRNLISTIPQQPTSGLPPLIDNVNKPSLSFIGSQTPQTAKNAPQGASLQGKPQTQKPSPALIPISMIQQSQPQPPAKLIEISGMIPQFRKPAPSTSDETVNKRVKPSILNKFPLPVDRNTKRAHSILCLFYGICPLYPKVSLKIGIGQGNNDKLVEKMLRIKGLASDSFYSKCNIVWTQVTCKRTALIDTNGTFKEMLLDDPTTPEEVQAYRIKSSTALTNMMKNLKLFKVPEGSSIIQEISTRIQARKKLVVLKPESFTIMNHIKGLKYISRKHSLFETVKAYCLKESIPIDSVVPPTWILKGDTFDADLEKLIADVRSLPEAFSNPLIIKPGENSNRGQGITIAFSEEETKKLTSEVLESRKNTSTVVVQKYIVEPMLFLKRKFDIRCYALVLRLPNRLSAFWYSKGYARTCSFEYSADCKENLMVHLTNEAVQVKGNSSSHPQTKRPLANSSQVTKSTTTS